MTDLTEFLLARIAEDEANVAIVGTAHEWRHALGPDIEWRPGFPPVGVTANYRATATEPDPQALRVIAAHRAIVALHQPDQPYCELNFSAADHGYFDGPCQNLRILASVYAEHPDYDTEWAPLSAAP